MFRPPSSMAIWLQDSVAQRLDTAHHRAVRRLLAVILQAQALGGVAHFGLKHAIETTQRVFDDGGAGRAVHTFDAQAFMHKTLVDRRADCGDQLANLDQADPLSIVVQAQPGLAVFTDDVCLINACVLKQSEQPFDASIPLIRDVRQHQRQIQ